jgi:regulator of replication initiation timing
VNPGLPGRIRNLSTALFLIIACVAAGAQDSSSPNDATAAAIRDLQQQVRELRESVSEMKSETAKYRAENDALRNQLQSQRAQNAPAAETVSYNDPPPGSADPQDVAQSSAEVSSNSLQESMQLLGSKIDDLYQTKVESASKYRVRLSGIVLFNLFSNRGTPDNLDVPSYITGPNQGNGEFGATMRQSEIGLEVFGPKVFGARTSVSLSADFGGGFPNTWNGVDAGIFRLRTASARLDWDNTSIVAGQDDLFISPVSPSSYASLLVPAFNFAGNLWAWTPQIRVEHRFNIADGESIALQGGVLDNLTGEFPYDSYFRSAGPGESSGQPGFALRTAWNKKIDGQTLTVGAAGYYSRQDYGYGHTLDGWAGMLDWQLPLTSRWSLNGEFYRGRALGGLDAAFGRSVIYEGNPGYSTTPILAQDTVGGWMQLKLRATPKLEFNTGYGTDNPTASEARKGYASESYVGPFYVQNRAVLGNMIYRPRSNLLLSAEYRYFQTFQLDSPSTNGQQINMMMGILF